MNGVSVCVRVQGTQYSAENIQFSLWTSALCNRFRACTSNWAGRAEYISCVSLWAIVCCFPHGRVVGRFIMLSWLLSLTGSWMVFIQTQMNVKALNQSESVNWNMCWNDHFLKHKNTIRYLWQRWCGQASAGDGEEENCRFLVHADSHLYFVTTVEPGMWRCGGRLGRQMECLLSFHCHRLHVRVCLKLCQGVSLCLSLPLVTENRKHKEPQLSGLAVIRDQLRMITCYLQVSLAFSPSTADHTSLYTFLCTFTFLTSGRRPYSERITFLYNWV